MNTGSVADNGPDREERMILRILCFLQARPGRAAGALAALFFTVFALSVGVESAHAQGISCDLFSALEVGRGSSNEKAFERALEWSLKYWRMLIKGLMKVWCSVLSEFDIPCG